VNDAVVVGLVAQLTFTALVGAVVFLLLLRRRHTVTEGREYAAFEMLSLVNRTLPHLRRGLDPRTAAKAADVIQEYIRPAAVGIVGGRTVLAHTGAGADHHQIEREPVTKLAREVLRSGRPSVARSRDAIGCPHPDCPLVAAVAAPLTLRRPIAGCLVIYFDESQ